MQRERLTGYALLYLLSALLVTHEYLLHNWRSPVESTPVWQLELRRRLHLTQSSWPLSSGLRRRTPIAGRGLLRRSFLPGSCRGCLVAPLRLARRVSFFQL